MVCVGGCLRWPRLALTARTLGSTRPGALLDLDHHDSPDMLGTPIPPDVPAGVATRARKRYSLLSFSHAFIDVFPIFFVVLMPLREKLGLTPGQADRHMITPIFSGCSSRCSRGSATSTTPGLLPAGHPAGFGLHREHRLRPVVRAAIALQIVGVLATGFYHPISTALAGQTAAGFRHGRAFAVGCSSPRAWRADAQFTPYARDHVSTRPGSHLARAAGDSARDRDAPRGPQIPHRADHASIRVFSVEPGERRKRWGVVASLTVQNALRFTVNVGMFALFNVWAESKIPDADRASVLSGELIACSTLGMGIGVILAGRLVKRGRERRAGGCPPSARSPSARWASSVTRSQLARSAMPILDAFVLGLLPLYLLAIVAPLGYFATFPITASLGQRLLPGHTSIATSLLMGVGWRSRATPCWPVAAGADLNSAYLLPARDISMAFVGFAALIVVAGILAACMRPSVIRSVAEDH